MNEHDKVCPNCGYCPTCGRSNQQVIPVQPVYPGVPTWPMFPVPPYWQRPYTYTVTTTGTSGNISIKDDPNVRIIQ